MIGFNKKHLLQIKNKTSPDVAQESINHFAYSLKYNKKTKEYPNPLATLITVLKEAKLDGTKLSISPRISPVKNS